jgi:hypothetical protein
LFASLILAVVALLVASIGRAIGNKALEIKLDENCPNTPAWAS